MGANASAEYIALLSAISDLIECNTIAEEKFKQALCRDKKLLKEYEELSKKVTNLQDVFVLFAKQNMRDMEGMKKELLAAINTQHALFQQGIHTVAKANTEWYDTANEKIKKRISNAEEVKLMCYFGDTDFEYFKDSLITALKKGCKIKILIVSEESLNICKQLKVNNIYADMIEHVKVARTTVKTCIDEIVNAVKDKKGLAVNYYFGESDVIELVENFEVRTYDLWPHNNILIVDEYIRFIPYFANRRRGNSIAIFGEIVKDNVKNVCGEFNSVFDDVWANASTELKRAPTNCEKTCNI